MKVNTKIKRQLKLFTLGMLFCFTSVIAQEEQRKSATTPGLSGITKNVIIGYAYTDFVYNSNANIQANFNRMGFSPTMIWKLGDKLFFESQVEFYTDSGIVKTGVEYGKLTYMPMPNLFIGMGKMMTPFGTYSERFEAPFIERFPNAPLGFKSSESSPMIGPCGSEVGIDLRTNGYLGKSKIALVVYLTNGAKLNDGKKEEKNAGMLNYENYFDNNTNKAIGGRLGFLPLSNSSLEIGLSGQYCKVGDAASKYEQISAQAWALDWSYVKAIPDFHILCNLKGQYNALHVDDAHYEEINRGIYTFNNSNQMWYCRLSIRPAYVKNQWLKNTEYLIRYGEVAYASEAFWGGHSQRLDLGFCYWMSLRTGLRLAWEKTEGLNAQELIMARFVTGF